VPRLFQVPGPLHLEHPFFRRLDLVTAGPQDHWIGSCRWTCEEYRRRGVAADRVFLSYYGADLDVLGPVRRGTFRNALSIQPGVSLLGMVAYVYAPKRILGHTRGVKGHEDFIEAVRLLLAEGARVRAAIVGGPWNGAVRYEQRLRALARRACRGAVYFAGFRDDVPAVYTDLDLAIHPSLSENCGGALESLAAGCPTVATAVGGLPDLVVDGETGWLVPPRAPTALADAIREALADPAEARRRAVRGRALVRELFPVERTAREIAAIYERVVTVRRSLADQLPAVAGSAA
jgi:glycosyltransferase involved in cell wall biosynthesis